MANIRSFTLSKRRIACEGMKAGVGRNDDMVFIHHPPWRVGDSRGMSKGSMMVGSKVIRANLNSAIWIRKEQNRITEVLVDDNLSDENACVLRAGWANGKSKVAAIFGCISTECWNTTSLGEMDRMLGLIARIMDIARAEKREVILSLGVRGENEGGLNKELCEELRLLGKANELEVIGNQMRTTRGDEEDAMVLTTERGSKLMKGWRVRGNGQTGIIQINLGKRRAAFIELKKKISIEKPGIVFIHEPIWADGNVMNIPGGKMFAGTTKNRNRATLWVNNDLCKEWDCTMRHEHSDGDMVAVQARIKVQGSEMTVILVSAYLPTNDSEGKAIKSINNPRLVALAQEARSNGQEMLLALDSNSHHRRWGCSSSDGRGKDIVGLVDEYKLSIMNRGSKATFETGRGRSIIDITLASSKLSRFLEGWRVEDTESFSDHKYVVLGLPEIPSKTNTNRVKKRTDWEKYKAKLEAATRGMNWVCDTRDELDVKARSLKDAIMQSYKASCKKKVVRNRYHMDWYNNELNKGRIWLNRQGARAAEAVKHKMPGWERIVDAYKAKRRKHEARLREESRKSWFRTTEALKGVKETARLQRLLENRGSKEVGSLIKPDGTYTKSKTESVEVLMRTHFPRCVRLEENERQESEHLQGNDFIEGFEEICSAAKIEWAIQELSPFKTPGEDGIFPALLQKGVHLISSILQELFKASLRFSYIPEIWRGTGVIFLPKAGKDSYDQPKSFRPISLMSFVLKTMEKVIDRSIKETALTKIPLDIAQHAYQKGKSTESALHTVVLELEKALNYKCVAAGIFVDIEGAFDNTGYDVIRKAIDRFGIEPAIAEWIQAMLSSRRIKAAIDKEEVEYSPTRGCPQGGCLSPLLWCLVVNELIVRLKKAHCYVIAFADDLVIIIKGRVERIVGMNIKAREVIKILEEWCRETGLNINPSKSVVLKFRGEAKEFAVDEWRMFNEVIPVQQSFKYLGVIMDSKMSWKYQMDRVVERGVRTIGITNAMVTKKYGLNAKQALWIFKQIVLPRMLYGAIVWWHKAVGTKKNCMRLESVHRKALMLATGAVSSTPTAALEALLDSIPLDLKIEETAMKTYCRLVANGTWRKDIPGGLKNGHTAIAAKLKNVVELELDVCGREFMHSNTTKVIINKENVWRKEKGMNEANSWYVDASVRRQGTGFGIYNRALHEVLGEFAVRMEDHVTITQAELKAIETSARICNRLERGLGERTYIITDSESALKLLNSDYYVTKSARDCFLELEKLGKRTEVVLVWCPAHKDIIGNELADRYAAKAAQNRITCRGTGLQSEMAMVKIEEHTEKEAKVRWKNKEKCRYSKTNIEGYRLNETQIILKLGRGRLRTYVGLKTAHAADYKFLTAIGKALHNKCRFCNSGVDCIEHFVFSCTFFHGKRAQHIGSDVENLKDCHPKKIIRFAMETDIYKIFNRQEKNERGVDLNF